MIERWYNGQSEPKLKMNVIGRDWTSFQAEFYLDQQANKLLNISKYKLVLPQTNDDAVITTEINDNDYFIAYNTINNNRLLECNYELIGLDENDNILIKSNKKLDINNSVHHPPVLISHFISRFDLIDKKQNGFVNLSEWISSMKQLLLNTQFDDNELLCRRIFYYMIHKKNNFEYDKFNNLTINEKDVQDFIDLYDVLVQPDHEFYHLIKILQNELCVFMLSLDYSPVPPLIFSQ